MAVSNKISRLVKNQFPDFYKEEGENFLAFIQAYYEYMEQEGKLTDAIRNLESYRDISTTTDDYIDYFFKTLLPSVPVEVLANKKLMAKYIKQFNSSRGTLASYKLMFRSIYNEDVELNYPADQILKVSDGEWRIDRYLVTNFDNATYKFIGKTIKGAESGAEALVEDVVTRMIRGRHLMQILLSNIKGKFNHQEPITVKSGAVDHSAIVDAGISRVSIITAGGEYKAGDVVSLISEDIGEFAKIVVTNTIDLGGALSFSIASGGSGYGASIDETVWGDTDIDLIGGDGSEKASFKIIRSDLSDTFALSVNINLVNSNTVYGSNAPNITHANSTVIKASTFANTIIGQTSYGFPEDGENVGNSNYRDHDNAVLVIANTSDPNIVVGSSLFGVTSGANATVNAIARAYNSSDVVLRIGGYKNFSVSEKVNISTSTGTTVGTVSSFSGNTIGYHVLQLGYIGNTALSTIQEGDELVGRTSGAYGVVKKVLSTVANGYNRGVGGADDRDLITVQVTANTTANLSSQFVTGPMKPFLENEGLRLVSSNTTVGNVVSTTSNSIIENVYTKLQDSFQFAATYFGSIGKISDIKGGAGYSVAPTVRVRNNDVAALGIGEAYLTLQSDDINWSTGNSSIIKVDSNDRLIQANTGASGDVKGVVVTANPHSNGTYEMIVRVWQDFTQREPSNINWANNHGVTLNIYDSSYTPGTADTRTPVDSGQAKIVKVDDRGVLGKNAVINASVGSNGTITGLRVIDSGYSYKEGEEVTIKATNRTLAVAGTARVTLGGAANSEGYYATSRSHLSSKRGYLQDSYYYQEFSYELISPIAIARYRDIALKLCHPAGQALFGKYRVVSNSAITVTANTSYTKIKRCAGTVSLVNGSFNITGSGTSLNTEFSNGDVITIEYLHNRFYNIPLNIVSSATSANMVIAWANNNLSSANAYYIKGSF